MIRRLARSFSLSVALLIAATSLAHAQLVFKLSIDDTHTVALFAGDTIRDTLYIMNDVGATSLQYVTGLIDSNVKLQLFKKLPVSLPSGQSAVGLLTISAPETINMIVGYTPHNGGSHSVVHQLQVVAATVPTDCISLAYSETKRTD